jgi:hypothetical protein
MPRVGFEPTIPAFERAKTFHVLGRAAGDCDRLYVTIGLTNTSGSFGKSYYFLSHSRNSLIPRNLKVHYHFHKFL